MLISIIDCLKYNTVSAVVVLIYQWVSNSKCNQHSLLRDCYKSRVDWFQLIMSLISVRNGLQLKLNWSQC